MSAAPLDRLRAIVLAAAELPEPGRGSYLDAACAGRGMPPAPNFMFGPPFSPSLARGVDQVDAAGECMTACTFSAGEFR